MNLCSDGHDEVCYEGRRCPACDVATEKEREIKRLAQTNDEQLDDIHELQKRVEDLESQIASS